MLKAGWQSLGWGHRFWFFSVLLVSLTFLVFIPPFQTNDEPSQWSRLWSAEHGELRCGDISVLARQTQDNGRYSHVRDLHQKFAFRAWDDMLQIPGSTATQPSGGNACVYIPVAYLWPALVMRPFLNVHDPRDNAGMLAAFYMSRVANWALMGGAVLLFLLLVPGLRNLTLVLYSLPTAIQQTVVVNQEAFMLALMFALFLLWAARPTLWRMLAMLLVVALLSAMKAVFLVMLIFWAASLWQWRREGASWKRVLPVFSLALIPVVVQALWSHYVVRVSGREFLPGWGVDPDGQMAWIRQNPKAFLGVLWEGHKNLLGRDHMHGGWTSVLGVLGWADFEIGERAYQLLFAALGLALVGDLTVTGPRRRGAFWSRYLLPFLASYLVVPAVMTAMYLVFTVPAGPSPLGVQGRYLLFPYFLMLALAIDYLQRRLPFYKLGRVASALPWACAALCLWADRDALHAILAKYH
jgi:hypothetical protein